MCNRQIASILLKDPASILLKNPALLAVHLLLSIIGKSDVSIFWPFGRASMFQLSAGEGLLRTHVLRCYHGFSFIVQVNFLFTLGSLGLLLAALDFLLSLFQAGTIQQCLPDLPRRFHGLMFHQYPLLCVFILDPPSSFSPFLAISQESHFTWLTPSWPWHSLVFTAVNCSFIHAWLTVNSTTPPGPFCLQDPNPMVSISRVFCKWLLDFGGFYMLRIPCVSIFKPLWHPSQFV